MYHRRDYLRICKHRFSLLSSHLSLSRLWQRLFFFRRLEIFWDIFLYLSDIIVWVHLSRSFAVTSDMIEFVTVVACECVNLIWYRDLTHFTIIEFLIIRIRLRCLRSKSCIWSVWLFATWSLIHHIISRNRFFIIFSDIFELDVHIS